MPSEEKQKQEPANEKQRVQEATKLHEQMIKSNPRADTVEITLGDYSSERISIRTSRATGAFAGGVVVGLIACLVACLVPVITNRLDKKKAIPKAV
jgi:hypothetical protein